MFLLFAIGASDVIVCSHRFDIHFFLNVLEFLYEILRMPYVLMPDAIKGWRNSSRDWYYFLYLLPCIRLISIKKYNRDTNLLRFSWESRPVLVMVNSIVNLFSLMFYQKRSRLFLYLCADK